MINAKSLKELAVSIKVFTYTMLARFKYRKVDYDEVCWSQSSAYWIWEWLKTAMVR